MEFSDMSVVVTACKRPNYLQEVLNSWANVIGLHNIRRFSIALGHSGRKAAMMSMISTIQITFPLPIDIIHDSPEASVSRGMHRALGEAASASFDDPFNLFTVFGEEDIIVSDDVLLYMRWAAEKFENYWNVIAVCAHNRGGTGWDPPYPAQDEHANQTVVRLLPYFNGWCWGTWADRWQKTLMPRWDWECDSGGALDSGYDWNLQKRVLPKVGGVCAVPDASRSQNIGQHDGWASSPESWAFSQSQSFRLNRGLSMYSLVEG